MSNNHQCYEVRFATTTLNRKLPDLHVKVLDADDDDILVECTWREPHCQVKIGSRSSNTSYSICRESGLNTDEMIARLNKDYYKDAQIVFAYSDTIVDEGIKWYATKELFKLYYTPCKKHRVNIFLKLEEMLAKNAATV